MLNRILSIQGQDRVNSSNISRVTGNSYLIAAGFFTLSSFASYSMTVTPATVIISVPDAGIYRGYALQVSGSYSCTTQDATLLKTSILSVSPATYNVTINDASLIKTFSIAIDPATATVTINDAALLKTSILSIDTVAYEVTANDADLVRIYSIQVDTIQANVTINDVNISRAYIMTLSGSYNVTLNELRGGIKLTKPATVVNEASTTADVVTEKTISTTITTQVFL